MEGTRLLVSKDYSKEGAPEDHKVISTNARLNLFKSNLSIQNSQDDGPSLTHINLHILHNLWLPDVEILDLKAFETHSVLSKLEGNIDKRFNFFIVIKKKIRRTEH